MILPDESGFDKGTAVRDKIRNKQVVSAIDDILTLQDFYTATINTFGATIESGARHALQGVKLEELFASILADPQNLRRYNGNSLETGYMYDVFCQVLETLGIAKGSVAHITATTKIPSLPSGGNPKTDVAATFTFTNGETIQPTFSLKNTSRRSVSVHEYAADTFADVLDPTNTELRRLLNVFQTCGNKRDMNPDDIEALTMVLKPYLNKLNHWVFAGEGAQGTSSIQIADYLVTHDKETDTFAIHTVEDYCNKLTREIDGSKWFGTIFSWTYPSKKRGKKIRLKAPIIQ